METQNTNTRKAYRQGELLFVPLDPGDMERLGFNAKNENSPLWKKLETNVIREGEATGHMHEVIEQEEGTVTMFAPAKRFLPGLPNMDMIGEEDRLLSVRQPAEVVHPEHKPLTLSVRIYLIIIQREYDETKSHRILD